MTTKKKAKELFDKYYPLASSYVDDRHEVAKQCALLMVDEMINTGSLEPQLKRHKLQKIPARIFEVEYWFEVKKEINEL